jgi:protein-disulfide isomerase
LDRNFSVGTSLGVNGTPSAILLDANGKVASPVVVGAPNVLAFMGAKAMNSEAFVRPNLAEQGIRPS